MIDGDALTILAKHPELLENHHSSWILTPHHGEFKRFVNFNQTSEMVDQANAFAKISCYLSFKRSTYSY